MTLDDSLASGRVGGASWDEPFCTVLPGHISDYIDVSGEQLPPNQTPALLRRVPDTLGPRLRGLPRDRARATITAELFERKTQMHREDLMNADMLSETLLLVSGTMILVTLLLILVAALTRTAALT